MDDDGCRLSGPRLLLNVLLIPALIAVVTIVPGRLRQGGAPRPVAAAPALPPFASDTGPAPAAVSLPPPQPSPREMTAMVYDGRQDDVVLFGGGGYRSAAPDSDTWTLDARGWHAQLPDTSPPALGAPLMAYDPATGTVVLVGVFPAPAEAATATLQTWSWDGETWSRRVDVPAQGESPLGLAALPATGELVLLTGTQGAIHTWTWSGSAWRLQRPHTELPLAAVTPALSADPSHGRVIALTLAADGHAAETWAWNGVDWSRLATTAAPYYNPITATMATDPRSGDLLLFVCGSYACSTWALRGPAWHLVDRRSPDIDTDDHAAQLLTDTRTGRVLIIGREGLERPNHLDTLWTFTSAGWVAVPASAMK